jgi:hypothetical protein
VQGRARLGSDDALATLPRSLPLPPGAARGADRLSTAPTADWDFDPGRAMNNAIVSEVPPTVIRVELGVSMLRVVASALLFAFVLAAALGSVSPGVIAAECDPDAADCNFIKKGKHPKYKPHVLKKGKHPKHKAHDGAKKSHKLLRKSKSHTPPPPRP